MTRIISILAGLMFMIGTAATADALSLRVSTDGTTWQTIADNQSGDTAATAGTISFNDSNLAGFTKVTITGDVISTPSGGALYTNSFEASGAAKTLYIQLSDIFTLGLPNSIGGNAFTGLTMQNSGVTSNLKTYYGSALFDTANPIADISLTQPGFKGQNTSLPTLTNPFSLTEFLTISNLSGVASQVTASLQVTPAPVPEPGTMMLFGVGLLGLAIYGKRRRSISKDVSEV